MKWQNESSRWRTNHLNMVVTALILLALLFAFAGAAQAADRTPADTGSGVEQVEETSGSGNEATIKMHAPALSAQTT